ncbi:MAG: metallophosphoesterase [Bacteroidia bacterium]
MFTQKGILPFLLLLVLVAEVGGYLLARRVGGKTRKVYVGMTLVFWIVSLGNAGIYALWGPKKILLVTGGLLFASLLAMLAGKLVWVLWGIGVWVSGRGKRFSPDRRKALVEMGAWVASAPAWVMAYGIGWGRLRFSLHQVELSLPNLPPSWDGVRIVQISDLHCGSFPRPETLQAVWQQITQLRPDMIVFTGDWINHLPEELDPMLPDLKTLHAPLGKWAILGNHDYGDYIPRLSRQERLRLRRALEKKISASGFSLLHNQHIALYRGADKIYLAGVGYWGYRWRFRQYGNLNQTLEGVPADAFMLLLTHDPSHWQYEVLNKKAISLTLSGHTHGLQMGIEWGDWRFSPAQYLYRYWAGLYQEKEQFIYVNRGIGYVGLPARVGIWPEVTLIMLHRGTIFAGKETRQWIG